MTAATRSAHSRSRLRQWRDGLSLIAGLMAAGVLLTALWRDASAVIATVRVSLKVYSVHKYGCLNPECERCLLSVEEHRNGVVLTGGSAAAFAIDVDLLQGSTARPLINCIVNGVQLDNFTGLLNVKNSVHSEQFFIHGINSWLMVAAPPRGSVMFTAQEHQEPKSLTALKYTAGYLHRHFIELQQRWRFWLSEKRPQLAKRLKYFPLTEPPHVDAKDLLMRRWVRRSPWVAILAGDADINAPPTIDLLERRLQRLKDGLQPAARHIFVNLPEHREIMQAQRKSTFAEARRLFPVAVANQGMTYVEVDYEKCGLKPDHFWKGFRGGYDSIDPVHLNVDQKQRMTLCLRDALASRNLLN